MKINKRMQRLAVGMISSIAALSGTVNVMAENWIPIDNAGILIFIPQFNFKAESISPQSYRLSWQEQSNTSSYKIERLSLDISVEVTNADIATHWKVVNDSVTTTSVTQTHDITSFDLGGHQTYRLSSCNAGGCTVLDSLHYFVKTQQLSNTIPQNFTITTTPIYSNATSSVKANLTSAKAGPTLNRSTHPGGNTAHKETNPYEWGRGFSMVSGHTNPAGHTPRNGNGNVNGKTASHTRSNFTMNQANADGSVTVTSHSAFLQWSLVDDATHYVITRTVLNGESPTKSFLYNSAHREWAAANSYTYQLVGGEYEFSVHACYDEDTDDDREGFCGGASLVLSETVEIPPIMERMPTNVRLSDGGVVAETQTFDLTWEAPTETSTSEQTLAHYNVYGELRGLIATVQHQAGSTYSLTRNTAALLLVPGRKYCYKIVPKYLVNGTTNTYKNGEPGRPSPDKCVAVGLTPVLDAPGYLSILEQQDESHSTYNIGYHFTWPTVAGADYYQLDREVDYGQGNWSPVYVGDHTYSRQLLTETRNEAFRVSACTADGRCGNYRRLYFWSTGTIYSGMTSDYKEPSCLQVPEKAVYGQPIQVSWCAPHTGGVDEYELKNSSGGSVHRASASSFDTTSQGLVYHNVDIGLPGSSYCFAVVAHFNGDASSYEHVHEDCGVVKPATPNKPTITVDNAAIGKFTLSWAMQEHISKYQIQEAFCYINCNNLTTADWTTLSLEDSPTPPLSISRVVKLDGIWAYRLSTCTSNNICSDYSEIETIQINRIPILFIHTDLLGTPVAETDEFGGVL
ncbi:MAG: hypothetical protein HRT35_15095 [Algicola sp.]|nr:hypothetical protein [Algicola sp.]